MAQLCRQCGRPLPANENCCEYCEAVFEPIVINPVGAGGHGQPAVGRVNEPARDRPNAPEAPRPAAQPPKSQEPPAASVSAVVVDPAPPRAPRSARPSPAPVIARSDRVSEAPSTKAGIPIYKPSQPAVQHSGFTLQIRDKDAHWRALEPIPASGLTIGRATHAAVVPYSNALALQHLRIVVGADSILVVPLPSRNGVYARLEPEQVVELRDGDRFKLGTQVIAFQRAPQFVSAAPEVSADGEEFQSHDIAPLGFLDLIRPDGSPGLRYPLLRPSGTKIGRGHRPGADVAIQLPDVEFISGEHAEVRCEKGVFTLHDLKSRNGTFLLLRGPTAVAPGTILLAGRALFRVAANDRK